MDIHVKKKTTMIHYGKNTDGELVLRITPDDVGEVLDMIQSANLQQRRVFNPLKDYIKQEYTDNLLAYQNRKEYKQ